MYSLFSDSWNTLSPNVITSIVLRSALRVDAQAGDGTVGTGAWWPYHDEGRQLRKDLSPWLVVRLTPEDSPWAFRTDGDSHRGQRS